MGCGYCAASVELFAMMSSVLSLANVPVTVTAPSGPLWTNVADPMESGGMLRSLPGPTTLQILFPAEIVNAKRGE